jgi:hypothetical protein
MNFIKEIHEDFGTIAFVLILSTLVCGAMLIVTVLAG